MVFLPNPRRIPLTVVGAALLLLSIHCSEGNDASSPSTETCSCDVTVNGVAKEWSGCGVRACVSGTTFVCSSSGATEDGACTSEDAGPAKDAGSSKDASASDAGPKDASTPKDSTTPSCNTLMTFACGKATCTLAQICLTTGIAPGCYDVPAASQCTPCSTQYGSTPAVKCPPGYASSLSGSSAAGCSVKCL